MIYDCICSLTKAVLMKQVSAASTEAMRVSAHFSGTLAARALFSASASWQLIIDSGPLSGKTIGLSFRTDLDGPSMAFIEDESGSLENPYIIMTGSKDELLRFKHAAIAAGANTTLRVELELERPSEMPELLPYSVKAFRYSVHSTERAPKNTPMH